MTYRRSGRLLRIVRIGMFTAVALSACGQYTTTATSPRASSATQNPANQTAGRLGSPLSYPGASIRLAPPPANAVPLASSASAYATCASGAAPCQGIGGSPTIALASFSDDAYGDNGRQPFVPTYQNVLAWVMTWQGLSCPEHGPAPVAGQSKPPSVTPTNCVLVVFVDAMTGHYLLSFSGPPPSP